MNFYLEPEVKMVSEILIQNALLRVCQWAVSSSHHPMMTIVGRQKLNSAFGIQPRNN